MMEINLTKHTLKTEELLFSDLTEMLVEDTVHINGAKEIKRIIKCCLGTVVTSKYVSDKTVTLEGTVSITVIYIDTNNCLANHEHTAFFSKTLQSSTDLTGGEVYVKITDEKCSAKQGGDNTLILSAGANLHVTVKKMADKEMICDIDAKNIEQLRGTVESTTPIAVGEKNLILEEEISLGNSKPAVDCIIRSNATAAVEETKIMGGKVMVKGTVKVYVLYHSVEGTRPQCFEESIPFSQLIDTQGVHDNCSCDAEVRVLFCEIAPRPMGDDEIRSFTASLKLAVTARAYCEDEIPTLLDAYSTAGGCSFVKENVTFKKLKETFCDRFIVKKTLEFTDGAIGSVIDMWCDIKGSSCKFEGNTLKINGTMLVNLLTYDCEGVPNCFERPIDFEYTYKTEENLQNPEAAYEITVSHCSYTITGENTVSVAAEPQITVSIYDNVRCDVIVDVQKDENSENANCRKSSIVLYFASKGEKLWDIARRFNSSVEEIKELNAVSEDILSTPQKFIIPTK